VLFWVIIEWVHGGKPTVLGAATGAVAGLVAITPACAFVGPGGAIAIGIGAAAICYVAVAVLKPRLGYDDSLDVFGVHGVGGTWGALATGLFIAEWGLPDGVSQGRQIWLQVQSILFTLVYAGLLSYGILFVLKLVMGDLRVDAEAEHAGLDLAEHQETAYGDAA
jgi:Amt family ammonium transporter